MKAFFENRVYSHNLPVYAGIIENMDFLAHWHTDLELLYVIEDSIRVGVNQDIRIIGEGDIVFCQSGKIHFYDDMSRTSKIILVIFHPKLIGYPEGWSGGKQIPAAIIEKKCLEAREQLEAHSVLKNTLFSLVDEYRRADSSDFIIISKLYEICGIMLRHFPAAGKTSGLEKENVKPGGIGAMYKVLNFIDSNYHSDISLGHVAEKFNLSKSYLSKTFAKTIGMNFSSYLASRRVLKAEALLREPEKLISEIAFDCGFESIRTFNRIFKSIRGISPSDYRRLHFRHKDEIG